MGYVMGLGLDSSVCACNTGILDHHAAGRSAILAPHDSSHTTLRHRKPPVFMLKLQQHYQTVRCFCLHHIGWWGGFVSIILAALHAAYVSANVSAGVPCLYHKWWQAR